MKTRVDPHSIQMKREVYIPSHSTQMKQETVIPILSVMNKPSTDPSPVEKPKVTPQNQSTVDQKFSSPLAQDAVQRSRSGRTLVRPKYLSDYTSTWFGEVQWNQCIVWKGHNNPFITIYLCYIVYSSYFFLSPSQWLPSQLYNINFLVLTTYWRYLMLPFLFMINLTYLICYSLKYHRS